MIRQFIIVMITMLSNSLSYNYQIIFSKVEKISDSDFGSSDSTGSSKISSIDEQLKQLGERNISKMVGSEYVTSIVINLLPAFELFIELALVIKFVGIQFIEQYMFAHLLANLGNMVLRAISQSGAQMAQKNLVKSQIIIANTYFAHTMVLEFGFFVIYCIVGLTIKIDRSASEQYLLIKLTGGLFSEIFGHALNEFYKIDNRTFIMLIQELVVAPVVLCIQCVMYALTAEPKLDIPAYSYLVGNVILMVWNLFSINHATFLDAEYRGVLRFSFKRLSPLRPRFLFSILQRELSNLGVEVQVQVLFIVVVVIIQKITYYPIHIYHLMTLYVGLALRALLNAINQSNYDTLTLLAGYNVSIKKITRVYECLKNSLMISFCSIPIVLIVFALITPQIRSFIIDIPDEYWKAYEFRSFSDQLRTPEILFVVGCLFPLIYQPVYTFFSLEDKQWFTGLVGLVSFAISLTVVLCLNSVFEDSTPFYLTIFVSEALSGMICLGPLIYFVYKYRGLYQMNIIAQQNDGKMQQAAQAQGETKVGEIRQSVMNQMDQQDQDEQLDKQTRQKNRIYNVFNKAVALRQSKMFTDMRDSIADTATARESFVPRGSQQVLTARESQQRDSQFQQRLGSQKGSVNQGSVSVILGNNNSQSGKQ